MRKRSTGSTRRTAVWRGDRRRIIVTIALVLSVVTAGVIFGQRTGSFSQASRKKASPQPEAAITPASFDPASPSKEYIYAGSSLIATEEPPGNGCNPSISPSNASYSATGGAGSVSVTLGTGCGWTAASNAAWITITSGSSGTGNGTVNYSVASNTGTARTGTITIANQTFTVNQAAGCSFAISPTSANYTASAAAGSVGVTAAAGCAWTASSGVGWITITSGASGSGNGTVNYSVQANSGGARSGTLTIAAQTFTVNQSASGCSFIISPTSANFTEAAGAGSVGVTAATGCTWTATGGVSWITITSGASGSGNGTVTYSVQANTGAARTGTMTIATQTFTVTQAAPPCSFSISPSSQAFAVGGGAGSLTVTAGAGCNWTAASNAAWITVTSGASGTGSGTVSYSVASNSGASRTGTMTVAGQTFTVTQSGSGGTICDAIPMSPPAVTVTRTGGAFSVNVSNPMPGGCSWTATSTVSWITITSGASGSGSGTINYTVGVYSGGSVTRQGKITININQGEVATHSVKQTP